MVMCRRFSSLASCRIFTFNSLGHLCGIFNLICAKSYKMWRMWNAGRPLKHHGNAVVIYECGLVLFCWTEPRPSLKKPSSGWQSMLLKKICWYDSALIISSQMAITLTDAWFYSDCLTVLVFGRTIRHTLWLFSAKCLSKWLANHFIQHTSFLGQVPSP